MMFVRFLVPAGAFLVITSAAAGRFDVAAFWAYAAIIYVAGASTYTWIGRHNPALLAERVRPPSDRDCATRRLIAVPVLAHLILAGFDVRFGWSQIPAVVTVAGLGGVAGALALVTWTLVTNPFASAAVRIQNERAHHVVAAGPYRFVRHPMYLAVFLFCLSAGPALTSWYAGLALAPVLVVFVRRTLIEDAMLQGELPGYPEYAARVRWRLVPGVF
jgi:protein-S-isoprenylcysteine O-methyltransferase Ste14